MKRSVGAALLHEEIRRLAAAATGSDDVEIRPAGGADARARAKARQMLAEHRARPSVAAVHEAAHEFVALNAGFTDARAFVRPGGEEGATYFTYRPKYTRRRDGTQRFHTQTNLRRRAAVMLAGPIAEAIRDGRNLADYETLVRSESRPGENPLLEFVGAASREFDGDVKRATAWVDQMLEEERLATFYDLRRAWPRIVARARELDSSLKEVVA